MNIIHDPIFGTRFINDDDFSRLFKCFWGERENDKYICKNPNVVNWQESICDNCEYFKLKYEEIYSKISNKDFLKRNYFSVIILLISFLVIGQLFSDSIFSLLVLKKMSGILLSVIGLLFLSRRILIIFRLKAKYYSSSLKRKIKDSLFYEYLIYPSDNIKTFIALLVFIILGSICFFFLTGPGQSYLWQLIEKYPYSRYVILFLGIPFLGLGILFLIIMSLSRKIAIAISILIKAILFLPRTIFWFIMILSDKIYNILEKDMAETLGLILSIAGIIILNI